MITDPTVLVLHNQSTFPSSVVPANITTLIVIGNYSPAGINYNNFTNVETLRMFDGEMTADIRTAIQNIAKINLKYLELKLWGESELGSFKSTKIIDINGFDDIIKTGNETFESNVFLESISLKNLISLNWESFKDCTNLKKAYLPKCVSLGSYVLQGCTSLFEITLPDNLNPNVASTSPGSIFKNAPLRVLNVVQSGESNLFADACAWINIRGQSRVLETSVFILNQDLPNLVARANSVLAQNLSEYPLLANATARILDVGAGITSISSISGSGNLINNVRMNGVDHAWP
jgi:hypothetical protein